VARLLDHFVGNEKVVQRLLESKAQDRFPHAVLLTGSEGVGKRTLALAFAQVLLCEKSEAQACGMCPSCLRVLRSQHESLKIVTSEKNQIKVEVAREILHYLSLRTNSKFRIVLIDQAHEMSAATSNTLLKCIEEPPEGTVFFLTAPSPKHVLPTIRSRCQNVRIAPLELEQLRKRSPRSPEWILRSAQGSFERLNLLSDKDEQEHRDLALRFLSRLGVEAQGYMDEGLRRGFQSREEAAAVLKHSFLLCRDLHYLQIGARDQIYNADLIQGLQALGDRVKSRALWLAEGILAWQKAIKENADLRLQFESFWIRFHQA
jgi:DNA polymerase-3 subunit delta'